MVKDKLHSGTAVKLVILLFLCAVWSLYTYYCLDGGVITYHQNGTTTSRVTEHPHWFFVFMPWIILLVAYLLINGPLRRSWGGGD